MTKTTNQRRTAASVVERIRKRLDEERTLLFEAEAVVAIHRTRLDLLKQLLEEAEKNGSDDE